MLDIRVNTNLLRYRFSQTASKQIRFAASQAINVVAKQVQMAERANLKAVLDKPTPFTVSAVSLSKSSKRTLTATVFVKDITAEYLEPYELGGLNMLKKGSSVLTKPIEQKVNQYGNIPRFTTAKLLARTDVFSGSITFGGTTTISGIWKRYKRLKAPKKVRINRVTGKPTKPKLRKPMLLIEYGKQHQATQRLNYRKLAKRIVAKNFKREFVSAMKKAIATANP